MAGMIEFVYFLIYGWITIWRTSKKLLVILKSAVVFQNRNNGKKFPLKVKMYPGTTLIWQDMFAKQLKTTSL